MNLLRNRPLTYLLFITPFGVIFFVFLGFPFFYALYLSFTRVSRLFDVLSGLQFVGLANYRYLFQDPGFLWGILASLYYAALSIPLGLGVSLALALLLHRQGKAVKVYRTLIFLPFVLDAFVVGIVWTLIYAPKYGALALILNVLHVASPEFGILSNPKTAMLGVVIAMTLKNAGFGMILFIAALDNISKEILEAADLDGAVGWRRLWHILLPLLKPVVLFLVVVGLIGALSAFAEFYAMTGGGPTISFLGKPVGATRVAGLYLFDHFQNLRLGLAAATSFTLLVLTLGVSMLSFRLLQRR